MDVYDAGVFVSRYEGQVPADMRTVLWGPLHAKELGMPGWEVQDGGETGFVYHKRARAGRAGTMLASLVVSNRARRATVTVMLAGFPSNASEGERNLEVLSLVSEAELFLTRLSGSTVRFQKTAGVTLVDQNHPQDELLDRRDVAPLPSGTERVSHGRRVVPRRLGGAATGGLGAGPLEADEEHLGSGRGSVRVRRRRAGTDVDEDDDGRVDPRVWDVT